MNKRRKIVTRTSKGEMFIHYDSPHLQRLMHQVRTTEQGAKAVEAWEREQVWLAVCDIEEERAQRKRSEG